jgi:hypothetical protein
MSEEKAPEVPKRKPWSSGDRRLLVITIAGAAAGGLAANLGTVLILGLGLAYLHERHSAGVSSAGLVGSVALLCTFFAAVFVPVMLWSQRVKAKKRRSVRWWLAWPLAAVLAASVLLFLVVLVGVAAGIK